jgi:hypothetical protein
MKFKAEMIGGPNDGQIVEIDEISEGIGFIQRVLERDGIWRVIGDARYKLQSRNPVRYVISN